MVERGSHDGCSDVPPLHWPRATDRARATRPEDADRVGSGRPGGAAVASGDPARTGHLAAHTKQRQVQLWSRTGATLRPRLSFFCEQRCQHHTTTMTAHRWWRQQQPLYLSPLSSPRALGNPKKKKTESSGSFCRC